LLKILDFTSNHIEQAIIIAKKNFEEEQKHTKILPIINKYPDFSPFVKNELGVSAFLGNEMVGYLCCLGPFKNAFGSTKAMGVWSPLHGNGLIGCEHKNIFAKMYQEAARKWVDLGITSHAITFYANNIIVQDQLFRYGFGLRSIDAIRQMETIEIRNDSEISLTELEYNNFSLIIPLDKLLRVHCRNSPTFLRYEIGDVDKENQIKRVINKNVRYFVAKDNNNIIAYIKISDNGESYISEANCMKNICGAYCLPEYRGKSVFQELMNYTLNKLHDENYKLLGVDFESFNPTASGFWSKYFIEYTHSVVRRIDDLFI